MPNLATVLKAETLRLCRREIRHELDAMRKTALTQRRDIAALKRQVVQLERQAKVLAKRSPDPKVDAEASDSTRPGRFVAKGLLSLRTRLGLSAPQFAQLLGVSSQSIYNWEQKKSVPRKEQLASLFALRSLGKREAAKRLEELKA